MPPRFRPLFSRLRAFHHAADAARHLFPLMPAFRHAFRFSMMSIFRF